MNAGKAAADASVQALLGCWLREVPGWWVDDDRVVIPLQAFGARITARIRRRSLTSRHRLDMPAMLEAPDQPPRPLDLALLAALLIDTLRPDEEMGESSHGLLGRIIDSASSMAAGLGLRRDDVERLWSAGPLSFADTEQALLLGHPVHPAPKSRTEMPSGARHRYSPEYGGRFRLRWLAVQPELVRHRSALADDAPTLAERLLRDDPRTDDDELAAALHGLGPRTLLPAHPFEADHLATAPETSGLFGSGAVVDLGDWGSRYLPTTSVRTVYRAAAPFQLKFSLHVRVTNSMRVTLPKELDRAVESAVLSRTDVGRRVAAVAPAFELIQDPAYLTIADHDGFSVLLRENRWRSGGSDVTCLTTLCQDHPFGDRNRLAAVVDAVSRNTGRSQPDVAREWFARFCDVVVRSLIRLYLDVGLCFEAHQQNVLIELEDGWPVRGIYRDSQGYFHREIAHDDLARVVPGLGDASESIFPEELADERLVYYLFVNLTLGVIDALGEVTDESVLLADLRELIERERKDGGRYPATLLDRLLDDDTWPCKANLLTRMRGMDELVGDIAEQSVYVTIPNPLRNPVPYAAARSQPANQPEGDPRCPAP